MARVLEAAALSAALLLLLCCVAPTGVLSARLPDPFEGSSGAFGEHTDMTTDLRGWLALSKHDHGSSKEPRTASVLFRYIVPTRSACSFVKEWRSLEKVVLKEPGTIVFDLKKTMTDNIIFVSYAEFEKKEHMHSHLEGKALRDFLEFVAANDIGVKMEPLFSGCSKDAKPPTGKGDKDPVAFLSKWIVAPHLEKGFIEAWADTVEAAEKAKGNRMYSLKKVLTDNVSFYLYSSWDKFEDLEEFMSSKDIKEFGEFVQSNGVVFFNSPLKKLGDQPE